MKKILVLPLLLILVLPLAAVAQGSSLVKIDAKPVLLCGGFRFIEGPVNDGKGNIYFGDIPNNTINIWTTGGDLKTYRDNSGGANGMAFDHDGSLVICEGGRRRVVRDDLHGKVTVLADSFNGKKLNSPNDLWIDAKGGIYFTDPRYGNTEDLEQDKMAVYYLPKNGQLERVADDLVKPNGVIGAPDGKTLYIADEGAGKVYAYSILKSGRLSKKRVLIDHEADGLSLDANGNLYLASDNVLVVSPDGKLLEEIHFPEHPTNLCFGGADGKTLFVAARTSLYGLQMTVSGEK